MVVEEGDVVGFLLISKDAMTKKRRSNILF